MIKALLADTHKRMLITLQYNTLYLRKLYYLPCTLHVDTLCAENDKDVNGNFHCFFFCFMNNALRGQDDD
jgi:hypothetical protein